MQSSQIAIPLLFCPLIFISPAFICHVSLQELANAAHNFLALGNDLYGSLRFTRHLAMSAQQMDKCRNDAYGTGVGAGWRLTQKVDKHRQRMSLGTQSVYP